MSKNNRLCQRCYDAKRRGVDPTKKFITDPRPHIVGIKHNYLPLGVDAKQGFAIIDKESSYLDKFNWHLSLCGYPARFENKKMVFLHWYIIGKPEKPYVTDHINSDKLDNRKKNLRHIPTWENLRRADTKVRSLSGHKNICWDCRDKIWRVLVRTAPKVTRSLGRYKDLQEAIRVRDDYLLTISDNI